MNIVKKQTVLKSFLSVFALCAINTQAMEQPEEDNQLVSVDEVTDIVETLHEAHMAQNQELCAGIFNHFAQQLNKKDPVEQLAVMVQATKIAAKKSKPLTLTFCNSILSICNNYPGLSEITPEIIRPLIPDLHTNNHTEAIKKIVCIFAGDTNSQEYRTVQNSIQHGLNNNAIPDIDDEAIARAFQQDPQHSSDEEYDLALANALDASILKQNPDTDHDEALARALSESLNETNRKLPLLAEEFHATNQESLTKEQPQLDTSVAVHNYSAQTHEDIAELEEEDNISIALEESLQMTPHLSNNDSWTKKLYYTILGSIKSLRIFARWFW